jgi:hypothetical protein
MKALLLVLVLVLAGGGAYYFYFKDHPLSWTQGPELTANSTPGGPGTQTATGKKDFKELCSRLQGAMDHIPVNLHDARQLPNYALDTRSKLAPHLQLHTEYVTLTQVCDLIIDADQAFVDHQEKCGFTPAGTALNPGERPRPASAPGAAVYDAQQALWNNQRLQADSKVRQLLATLENRRL